jgi:hypothetical protein
MIYERQPLNHDLKFKATKFYLPHFLKKGRNIMTN